MDLENTGNDLKFCQQEVEFINSNFEAVEGGRIQRSAVYSYYVNFCKSIDIEPMSLTFLGKFIKMLYPHLKIRRLGARGESKYTYFGLRIKPASEISDLPVPSISENYQEDSVMGVPQCDELLAQEQEEFMSYIGDISQVNLYQLPSVVVEDNELLPEGIHLDDLNKFEDIYKRHCNDILSIVSIMDLTVLPYIWNIFWHKGDLYESAFSNQFPPTQMANICLFSHCECIHKFVFVADCAFYSILLNILMPDVFRALPESYILVLRNLSKNLEPWLMKALAGIPEGIFKAKLSAAKTFGLLLRQYTALNHSVQACRTLFLDIPCISQMLTDYQKVDFEFIMNQIEIMCKCDTGYVKTLTVTFKNLLALKLCIEKLIDYMEEMVGVCSLSITDNILDYSKFLTNWSFAGGLFMRDLMLRCVPSLGAFNLLKLFCDDYLLYSVQRKIAECNETNICHSMTPKF